MLTSDLVNSLRAGDLLEYEAWSEHDEDGVTRRFLLVQFLHLAQRQGFAVVRPWHRRGDGTIQKHRTVSLSKLWP